MVFNAWPEPGVEYTVAFARPCQAAHPAGARAALAIPVCSPRMNGSHKTERKRRAAQGSWRMPNPFDFIGWALPAHRSMHYSYRAMPDDLTPRQEAFARGLAEGRAQGDAYIKAGYSAAEAPPSKPPRG